MPPAAASVPQRSKAPRTIRARSGSEAVARFGRRSWWRRGGSVQHPQNGRSGRATPVRISSPARRSRRHCRAFQLQRSASRLAPDKRPCASLWVRFRRRAAAPPLARPSVHGQAHQLREERLTSCVSTASSEPYTPSCPRDAGRRRGRSGSCAPRPRRSRSRKRSWPYRGDAAVHDFINETPSGPHP